MDSLEEEDIFSAVEVSRGYWKIINEEVDRDKTALAIDYRILSSTSVPFEYYSAPS